ncbi:heterokaryon incompatibility protein-domain-containing protein, partial [Boeremia exigua]|uniref:heterokaryon incompatibility protein-domain-containing protein n=1 Tax=Boeremia exigua TaxID=749465 RepID=UPI001E8E1945
MTNTFVYEELDLESRSFRLIRLCRGDEGPTECELLHAYVGDDNDGMEYEALSYTWGDLAKPCNIKVNGQVMHITKNLSEVLEHLRLEHEDRFLWIDALCINQDDYKERGHQVRQMASIYERARQVIFWLGTATVETNRAFHLMQLFGNEMLNHPCNNWQPSDERWQFLWSNVLLQVQKDTWVDEVIYRADFMTLLFRDWFERIWIIQEVVKARSARVACGTESVSARVFALFPEVLKIRPLERCQAVLDIMPGPSRKFSWWLVNQDLETLLRKFQSSKASDPRDMVYALLGICSNAHGAHAPNPDYTKTLQELIHITIAFLLRLQDV